LVKNKAQKSFTLVWFGYASGVITNFEILTISNIHKIEAGRRQNMDTNLPTVRVDERTLWHITIDLAYDGCDNESCQEGVHKVLSALSPLIENGSGIKQVLITKLPEKV
jgi:hypothetical protein